MTERMPKDLHTLCAESSCQLQLIAAATIARLPEKPQPSFIMAMPHHSSWRGSALSIPLKAEGASADQEAFEP